MKFLNYKAKEGDIIIYRFANLNLSRKERINVSVWKICKNENKISGRLEDYSFLIGLYDVVLVKLSPKKIEYKIENKIEYKIENATCSDYNWIKPIKDLDQKALGEEFELDTVIMGDRMVLKKIEPDDYIGKLFIWIKGFKTLIEYRDEC